MRHLSITEYGQFIGCSGGQLQVKSEGVIILETPLSRLRTISISKKGVSFSSDLLLACASRGIRLFVLDWKGLAVAALVGQHQHTIAALRKAQFDYIRGDQSHLTAAEIIYGKIRNQRAVLLYFNKYLQKTAPEKSLQLMLATDNMAARAKQIRNISWVSHTTWRAELMGYEGAAASVYWQALSKAGCMIPDFTGREGRGALDITNQLLNYGYTLLASYIWSALDNAGFELYEGILHKERAGKPSLVLDMMEEYRPWVVDRNVIKMRSGLKAQTTLNTSLKKQLSNQLHKTMSKKLRYKKKYLRLETIIQRQMYLLAATIVKGKPFKSYRFLW